MCIRDRFKGAEKNYFTTEKELLSIVRCLEKFRIYILGQPLTIITDNKALTFMNKCHLNNSRITRWILSIQEYKFDIIHCKGTDNVVADILSRYPENVAEGGVTDDNCEYQINHMTIKMNKDVSQIIKNIGKYQLGDSKLRIIIDKLRSNCEEKDLCKFYKYSNEKLYRKCKDRWKLYIPTIISGTIIAEIHQMYGHLGTKKCTKMIQEHRCV